MEGKVFSFDRGGQFYNQRGKKLLKAGKMVEAVKNFRIAVEKSPEEDGYHLDLANALTMTGNIKGANDILYNLQVNHPQTSHEEEIVANLAMNAATVGDCNMAKSLAMRYLEEYPKGQMDVEMEDILRGIEDMERQAFILENAQEAEIRQMLTEAKVNLLSGNFKETVRLYEQLIKHQPKNPEILNNLTLAYFCVGKKDKALKLANRALKTNPGDVHALCNILIMTKHQEDPATVREIVTKINSLPIDSPEELQKVMFTMAEIGEDQSAHRFAKRLVMVSPYQIFHLHSYAVTCYHLHMYAVAEETWSKIIDLDPYDLVARHYLSTVKKVATGAKPFKRIPSTYQLPIEEVLGALKELNEAQMVADERELMDKWKADDRLYTLLRWGLWNPDVVIKEAALFFLTRVRDRRAHDLFRAVLTDPLQNDSFKREVLEIMCRLEIDLPMFVNMNGITVPKDNFKVIINRDSSPLMEGLRIAMIRMMGRYIEYEEGLYAIWSRIGQIKGFEKAKAVKAIAALLEYLYLREKRMSPSIQGMTKLYRASEDTLRKYIRRYDEECRKEGENDETD